MFENDILNAIGVSVVSLIFLIIVFVPMEKVFPAKRNQKIFRAKHSLLLDPSDIARREVGLANCYLLFDQILLKDEKRANTRDAIAKSKPILKF